ncbi:hypothetical protein KUV57_12580 [Epibacterium sp. DP7N7-1]|nr:hypothetical protein [Epibacterium sp. DP7N7-1]
MPESLFDLILGAEVRAARIEGHLATDPVIAAQWRAEAAVAESVASIGLEDIRVSETDLLMRVSENPEIHADVRAVEDALSALRFLRSPGDPGDEPKTVLERIARLAARAETDEPLPDMDLELQNVFQHCKGRAPILEAIRASASYAALTERRSPVGERLVFVAAEHLSRGRVVGSSSHAARQDDPLRGLGGRVDASWVVLPSLALTRMKFRIWSPLNPQSVRDFLRGVSGILDQELGRLIAIRSWHQQANEIAHSAHGRSRLPDAISAFGVEPILTSAALAERIGVTPRGALNLLDKMVSSGLLVELTRRRSARIWSTPGLAALLAKRVTPSIGRSSSKFGQEAKPGPGTHSDVSGEGRAAVERALTEFDAVLEKVDGILARIGDHRHD